MTLKTLDKPANNGISKHKNGIKLDSEEDELRWPGKGLALPSSSVETQFQRQIHPFKELLRGLIRGGLTGALLKGTISAILPLLKGKKINEVIKSALSWDTFQFARFLAVFSGLFRFATAELARRPGKETVQNAAIAGAVASTAILLDAKHRRKDISLYLFVRALDVVIKRWVRLKVWPEIPFAEEMLFGLCNVPIMYGFLYEPSLMDPGYYKWIRGMGAVPEEGIVSTFRKVRDARVNDGVILPFRECNHGYHEGPCMEYIVKDYIAGLFRAGKIYLPVHLIPLILFRLSKLSREPFKTLRHTFSSYLASCFFLSTYVLCIKGTVCSYRNTYKKDTAAIAVIAGLLTSVSTLLERKSRVSELMLYCWPRSLEVAVNYLKKYHGLPTVHNWELPIFSFAMAVLMSSNRLDFKPTFHDLLCNFVGA